MGRSLHLFFLIIMCSILTACAGKQENARQDIHISSLHMEPLAQEKEYAEAADKLLSQARSAIGTPYVRGGTKPGGFDCSGLVLWAYKSVGISLPRTAREQSRVGKHITEVSEMRPGDIVAFRHPKRGYHTGIYVGEGKFIHSPRRRKTVRINRLSDSYFCDTFLGARRVNFESEEDLVAQAQSRLSDYAEEKAVRDLTRPQKDKKRQKPSRTQVEKKKQKVASKKTKKRRAESLKAEKRRVEKRRSPKKRADVKKAEKRLSKKSQKRHSTKKNKPAVKQQKKRADIAQQKIQKKYNPLS